MPYLVIIYFIMKENLGRRTRKILFIEIVALFIIFFFASSTPGLLLFGYLISVTVNIVLIILQIIYKPKLFYLYIIFMAAIICAPVIALLSIGKMC